MTVDDVLRDLAKRGELSHISITPSQNGKLWRASFTMCSMFGASFAEDADPAKAIILACTTAKMRKRPARKSAVSLDHEATLAADTATREVDAGIRAASLVEDPLADLM